MSRSKHSFGYGHISSGRSARFKVHRVVWGLSNGPIPEGMCVCHKCDNPSCCNIDHLFLGTKADNTRDMLRKSRGSPPPIHTGEKHPASKCTDAQMYDIINDARTLRAIAKDYGLSVKTVWRMKHGLTRNAGKQRSD